MGISDIYFFSGTHWDREWYQTFQGFRYRLVEMVDEMLDYLENEPGYGVYHFDGQTIVLEDYMEIAPENEGRLRKLITDGRIKIGPWYNMPDEFLLSGESLIRNLMTGAKVCRKWGAEPWKAGYVCDIFGHIAQMPQIFNGFGIDFTILGRGTTEADERYINWQAPDGSECTAFLLEGDGGYANIIKIINTAETKEELKEILKEELSKKESVFNAPVLILMDGWDHNTIHKDTPEYLEVIKELYPEANVRHCNLEEAAEQLKSMKDNFPVKVGELNKTAIEWHSYLALITYTLSSYYTLKKANDECQNMLEKKIEPMMLYSAMNGKKFRRSFLERAYKYLMQNHPHDSICGCSVEQVHKDMVYRFDQAKEISETLLEEFLYANKNDRGESSNYVLRLYNPLPFARMETVEAEVILKNDFPCRYAEPFGYEDIFSFKLTDAEGNEIPYGISKMQKNYSKRVYRIQMEKGECYKITFEAQIPAGGYSEYKLTPYEKPVRYLEKLTSGRNYAENDFIKLSIDQNGEISIYDKKTNKEYTNLCGISDDGEIGDGWYHANPVNDLEVYSCTTGARIEKTENSPARCVFRIIKEITVPEKMENEPTGLRRSDRYVKIPVVMEVGLSKNARYADVKMKINNIAEDHRMRLIIPTDIEEKKYFAGQAYYCNERKTGIDLNTAEWRECDPYEKQMNGIVGKREKDGTGIAFVSAEGLHECAGLDDGSIYVTLFRGFQRTVQTMGEPGGQILGDLSFSFRLIPLDKEVTYSGLVKHQDKLAAAPVISSWEIDENYTISDKSFMQIEGEALNLSIVKLTESGEDNAAIVRIYNASGEDADGKIIFSREILKAYETNLNEDVQREVQTSGKELEVCLKPWKIQTYKMIFKGEK